MTPKQLIPATAASLILAGCESMIRYDLEIEIPVTVQSSYTDEAPGVLLVGSASLEADLVAGYTAALLCDPQTASRIIDLSTDWHFGCAPDSPWLYEAWVSPVPADWNPAELCAGGVDSFVWDRTLQPLTADLLPTESSPYASGYLFDDDYHHTDICGGEDNLSLVLE